MCTGNGRDTENAAVDAFVRSLSANKAERTDTGKRVKEKRCQILEAFPDSTIPELDLTYVYDKSSLEKPGEILPQTKLKKLSFSNEFITDEESRPVFENHPPGLETIDLSRCGALTDKSAGALLPYIGKTNLKNIDLMIT